MTAGWSAALFAEWGKTWSVRAPLATLLGVPIVVIVTAFTLANDFVVGLGSGEHPGVEVMPIGDAIGPAVQFGMVVLAAFAMSPITTEYSTRTIASTLAAQPRRARVLSAKTLIVAAVGLVVGVMSGVAGVALVDVALQGHLAPGGENPILTGLRVGALFAATAVLALGIGAIVRSSVGTLSIATMVLVGTLVLPPSISVWTPGGAAGEFLTASDAAYPSAVGLAIDVAWAAAAYGLGLWAMRRRDA